MNDKRLQIASALLLGLVSKPTEESRPKALEREWEKEMVEKSLRMADDLLVKERNF